MSEHKVDLSQIRGDWHFHCRYVTNAMEQTLKRLQKTWRAVNAKSTAAGEMSMDPVLLEELLEACRQTRALTDDINLMRETQPAKRASGKFPPKGKSKRSSAKASRKRK
jgi:hypothetical protein